MSQQVTITGVDQLTPWSKDGKTFHSFLLTTSELDKPVKVNRLPTSPAIETGQQIWLEDLQVDAGRPTQFKAKVGKDPNAGGSWNGGGSRSNDDPETRKSIEKQVALKAAVEYEARKDAAAGQNGGALSSPMDVTVTAQVFADWLAQS